MKASELIALTVEETERCLGYLGDWKREILTARRDGLRTALAIVQGAEADDEDLPDFPGLPALLADPTAAAERISAILNAALARHHYLAARTAEAVAAWDQAMDRLDAAPQAGAIAEAPPAPPPPTAPEPEPAPPPPGPEPTPPAAVAPAPVPPPPKPAPTPPPAAPAEELDRPKWTAARRAMLREMWLRQDRSAAIAEALNTLPGPPVTANDVPAYATSGLHLPSRTAIAANGGPPPPAPIPSSRAANRPRRDWITEERDALFRRLWFDENLTIPQVFDACAKLPGPPLPTGGSTANDWAARLDLPRPRATVMDARYGTLPPPVAPMPAPPPPAPATTPDDAHSRAQASALRQSGHNTASIARRTGLPAETIEALHADALAQARALVALRTLDTEAIAAECGLPPATVRELRAGMKPRAA